jgi:hypothetical protein
VKDKRRSLLTCDGETETELEIAGRSLFSRLPSHGEFPIVWVVLPVHVLPHE